MAATHGAVRARYHALGRVLDARKRAAAKRASGSGTKSR